ncbi:YqgE/AlgH family protein [Polaribacter sp. Z014]|uniref:YqgE/AlgH family protein n=1 Tax=unclassified Polaribacter TaxID=196858 RepID=UPI00193BB9C6|nr:MULTISPECIES: YqgE/AlgH family protein [unclassified Polaribacter]MCL7764459.1 YqgE/AlgH family protein [Polaribacter sp. Z014]QVY66837.1 YqgE/AlgH family protein [Polaribacter sp. Q13]
MKLNKGKLLIAEPSILNDSAFNRTIVLLTEHTPNNSVGFILNRPLNYTINDLLPEIDCNFPVYQGGPVEQDNLYFVHKVPQLLPDSIEVANGIFWGGSFECLKNLLNNDALNTSDIRFFLGYSGWEKEQLDQEMNQNSWFISDNDFENIFSMDDESLWKNKLLQKGGNYKLWANAPSDFNLN